jgi:excisionase family DNA binding protein
MGVARYIVYPCLIRQSANGLPRYATTDKRLCITVPEAAKMLVISRNFAYELVKRGELPVVKFGKRLLVPRLALEKRLEKEVTR